MLSFHKLSRPIFILLFTIVFIGIFLALVRGVAAGERPFPPTKSPAATLLPLPNSSPAQADTLQMAMTATITIIKDATPTDGTNFAFTTSITLPIAFAHEWGEFGTGNGQFKLPFGLAVNGAGNVYVSDLDNHRIQVFDSSGNYLFQWGSFGSGNGQFSSPGGLALDASGNIYVADRGNNRIQVFDSNGNYLFQWGSFGSGDGQFRSPNGVMMHWDGNIYVADSSNDRIQVFDSSGNYLFQWGGNGSGNGEFDLPVDLAVNSAGTIYVSDNGNFRMQAFDSNGNYLFQWGGFGTANGQFFSSVGVDVDEADNVYVADSSNYRVQVFGSSGTYLYQWGSEGSGAGEFYYPLGLTLDANDNVYVTDSDNHRVQVFSSNFFSLDDAVPDDGDAITDTITFSSLLPGSYNFAEILPGGGWALLDMSCDTGSWTADLATNTLTVNPTAGEAITCTFSNNGEGELAITKSDSPDPVLAGQALTYTLTITNNGLSTAVGVLVTDTLPTEFDMSGNNCGATGNPLVWHVGSLAAAATQTCTITGMVMPSFTGIITNVAQVSSPTYDPILSNNVFTETTTVLDNLFSVGDVILAEGDSGDTLFMFTVTRTEASLASSVAYATIDGTAVSGADYTAVPPTTLTFTAGGALTQTAVVTVTGETLFELNETFTVTLASPINGSLGDNEGVGTIVNDDALPTLNVDDVTGWETAGTFPFTVTLSAVSGLDASLSYSTTNGAAVSGSDYTGASGNLTIPAGSVTGVILVTILDDALLESTETFTLTLSSPLSATIGDGTAVGTIIDDENPPNIISVSDVMADEAAGLVTFTVSLDVVSGLDVTVAYATSEGTATAGEDYTAVSGSLTIANGTVSNTISVPILDDNLDEITETFSLDLSNAVNAVILDAQGVGTIVDNDESPVAVADAYTTTEDMPLVVVASGVLSNDSDGDGDDLTAVLDTMPSHGSMSLSANGSFIYTPTLNFNGADSFMYHASDGVNDSHVATVMLTVTAVNDAPTAVADTATTMTNNAITVAVLANDMPGDEEDVLLVTAVSQPANGSISLNPDSTVTYSPTLNFLGDDLFSYVVSDGVLTDTAVVTITVLPAPNASLIYLPLIFNNHVTAFNLTEFMNVMAADAETAVAFARSKHK